MCPLFGHRPVGLAVPLLRVCGRVRGLAGARVSTCFGIRLSVGESTYKESSAEGLTVLILCAIIE